MGISSPYFLGYLADKVSAPGPRPNTPQNWRSAAAALAGHEGAPALWEGAAAANGELGLPAPRAGALHILTGQQVRLFGGPLFLVYKILTAATLAAWCRDELGLDAQAIFLSETEDDDWDEVRTARWLDGKGRPKAGSLPAGEPGLPIGGRPLTGVEEVLDALEGDLAGPGAAEAVGALREAMGGDTYAEGHHRLLAGGVLGRLGVPLVASGFEAKKVAAAAVLAGLVEVWDEALALMAKSTATMKAAGYGVAINLQERRLPLFRLAGGRRHAVHRVDGVAKAANGEEWGVGELPAAIREEPLGWGPHVVSRPLIRDATARPLAVVLGPGELAYHGQLAPLWGLLGIPQPLWVPRLSATLLGEEAAGTFRGVDDLALLKADPAGAVAKLGAARLGELGGRIDSARAEVAGLVEPLLADLEAALPGLRPTLSRVPGQLSGPLEKLARQAGLAAAEGGKARVRRLGDALWPGGRPQERALCPAWAESEFGPGWAEPLAKEVTPCPDRHVVACPQSP